MHIVRTFGQRLHRKTVAYLFSVDLFFIAATAVTGVFAAIGMMETIPAILNIGRDWSAPETFNYLKWLAIASVFLLAYLRQGKSIYAVLSAIFLILMLDDSLEVHEQVGTLASVALVQHEGYRDIAQIVYWLILAASFLFLLRQTLPRTSRAVREQLTPMLVPFAGLAFFGVFVDFLHSFAEVGSVGAGLFILIEDGAELLLISCLLAYAVNQFAFAAAEAKQTDDI